VRFDRRGESLLQARVVPRDGVVGVVVVGHGYLEKEMQMDLIILVLVVALIGFLVWVITTKVPMPPGWAMAIQVLALVVIILYILTRFVSLPNVLTR